MRFMMALGFLCLTTQLAADTGNWNQFRGPNANGWASDANPPVEFGEDQNVTWKTAIEGKAWSSPVVWDDTIWLTNAPEDGKQMFAVAVDSGSGKILHNIKVFENEEPQYCHSMNSYATPTPVVEEGRLYVHFGVHGTACVDTSSGKVLWSRRDLPCNHHRGPASSPIVDGDRLVLLFDGFDVQYVVALDKHSGKTIWKTPRTFDYGTDNGDRKKAYCTPAIISVAGRPQLITPAAVATEALDPKSGKLLWTVRHGGMNASARPVFDGKILFVTNGMGKMVAVRPQGTGDISDNIVWDSGKGIPKKSSLLLIDGLLYMVSDDGIASCVEAATGEKVWTTRLGGSYAASPVYAGGRIYFSSIEGVVHVIEPGRKFKSLAKNTFDAGFMASPAVVGNALILRTKTHLYRVEKKG